MPNRLINETSPYLQQHAHNPVDWYPWGPEALERARREGKPILLSIGYAACHWCHVMERESFEDPEIAALMNQHFVSIKVDREERPDLDAIYMQAVQVLTGRGGWPMTVFLTPDQKPFYGGTYFPPEDRGGMPGFPRILQSMAQAYATRRAEVAQSAEQLAAYLRQATAVRASPEPLMAEALGRAYQKLAPELDTENGGFGGAPKFPQPATLEFLLRHGSRIGDRVPTVMVDLTLDHMARGGIYDHLGGGFHRYSTDAVWLVPHFEKMLYDNALLARLYLHGFQATGHPRYRRVVEETLDYALRDMRDPSGGFYSAQDADSEGHEGKFYVWSHQEVLDLLGQEGAEPLMRYYDITEEGNFEGVNILHLPQEPQALAAELGIPLADLEAVVAQGRARLHEARRRRIWPLRDEKVLTAWNGMMLCALAEAAAVLGRRVYLDAATATASFLLDSLRRDGRLLRTWRDGQAKLKGYLEDYAFLIEGLVALYEASGGVRWIQEARSLAESMLELFWDPVQGVFFDTGRDHEALLVRPRDIFDGAVPCGSSAAAMALLRLGALTGVAEYRNRAGQALRSVRELILQSPAAFGYWLSALDLYLSTPKEVAIVGPREHPATQSLLGTVYRAFLPNKVVAVMEPGDEEAAAAVPLLEGRGMVGGQPTAFVCENFTCQMPVTEPAALAAQLQVPPEEPFVPSHRRPGPSPQDA
jgi:hypothetical protein